MKESKISTVLLVFSVAVILSACSSNQGTSKSSSKQSQTVASKQQAKISINDLANSATAYPQTASDGTVVSYTVVPDEAAMVKINRSLPKKSRITQIDFAQAFIEGNKSKGNGITSPHEVDLAQVARSLNHVLDSDLTNPDAHLKKYVFVGNGIKTYTPVKSENKNKDLREIAE